VNEKRHGVQYLPMNVKLWRARCRTKSLILAIFTPGLSLLNLSPLRRSAREFRLQRRIAAACRNITKIEVVVAQANVRILAIMAKLAQSALLNGLSANADV